MICWEYWFDLLGMQAGSGIDGSRVEPAQTDPPPPHIHSWESKTWGKMCTTRPSWLYRPFWTQCCCACCKMVKPSIHTQTQTNTHTHTHTHTHTGQVVQYRRFACVHGSQKHDTGQVGGAVVDNSGVLTMQARPIKESATLVSTNAELRKTDDTHTHTHRQGRQRSWM